MEYLSSLTCCIPKSSDKEIMVKLRRIIQKLANILQIAHETRTITFRNRMHVTFLYYKFRILQNQVESKPICQEDDVQFIQILSEFRSAILCINIIVRTIKYKKKSQKHNIKYNVRLFEPLII